MAIGLLTQSDLNLLGPTFSRAWPVDSAPAFTELVRAIDLADDQSDRPRAEPDATRRT